eukprot:TRINITY_DN0_c8567_g1_i1.p1 TRINITY_DN0_c8567_g1~~TRINITY_DN0_c8567_g1_i1.p1  ORF type:complete len:107 (-),score=5.61 TRINITY_DN0_c8567_g1_i1:26-346(-)
MKIADLLFVVCNSHFEHLKCLIHYVQLSDDPIESPRQLYWETLRPCQWSSVLKVSKVHCVRRVVNLFQRRFLLREEEVVSCFGLRTGFLTRIRATSLLWRWIEALR